VPGRAMPADARCCPDAAKGSSRRPAHAIPPGICCARPPPPWCCPLTRPRHRPLCPHPPHSAGVGSWQSGALVLSRLCAASRTQGAAFSSGPTRGCSPKASRRGAKTARAGARSVTSPARPSTPNGPSGNGSHAGGQGREQSLRSASGCSAAGTAGRRRSAPCERTSLHSALVSTCSSVLTNGAGTGSGGGRHGKPTPTGMPLTRQSRRWLRG
jgi:hypothetical protein